MKQVAEFRKALGASALTGLLMFLDRVVLNFVPLYFWGAEVAGVWIFLRSWNFLLTALEGGAGGKLSNDLALIKDNPSKVQHLYTEACKSQISWGVVVFILNTVLVFLCWEFGFLWFDVGGYFGAFVLLGLYSVFFFQSQMISYKRKGIGEIYSGQMFVNGVKLIEIFGVVIVPALHGGIFETILTLVAIRFFFVLYVAGFRNFLPSKSIKTDFSYFLIPLVPALYNFVPVFVVGQLFGGVSVTQFSICKMAGRIIVQVSQVLSRVLWPSVRSLQDGEQYFLIKNVVLKYFKISTILLLSILLVGYLFDEIELSDVRVDFEIFSVLVLASYLSAFSDVFISILVARGRQQISLLVRFILAVVPVFLLFKVAAVDLFLLSCFLFFLEVLAFLAVIFFYFVELKKIRNL